MAAPSYFVGVDTGGTYTDAAVIEASGHKVVASAKALTTKGDLAVGVAEALPRQLLVRVGVDTGGTYTDAAVIEAAGHKVIASAKALTTKGDLAIGVAEAITAAIASLPKGLAPADISLVSVSTTLATNAVVEGHGSAVGVILIGFDAAMAARTGIAKAFPGMPIAHDRRRPRSQWRCASARSMRRHSRPPSPPCAGRCLRRRLGLRGAQSGPRDAKRASIIVARTAKPVTLSTELTSALDAPRRALTAVLNARLISRISHADRGGAPGDGRPRHRLPADDRQGRRHAGARRDGGDAAHRDGAVGPGRQSRGRGVAFRPWRFHHVRHGRHHHRSRRPRRRAAAGERGGRRSRRLAHHGQGHRRQDHRARAATAK